MTCLCRKCLNERAGPFALIHPAIKIVCRECGDAKCPRAKDHESECSRVKVDIYGF
jgi:hypothetical protein